jgi:hypothetical protein
MFLFSLEGALLLATEKMDKGAKAKGTRSKEEKLAFHKQDVVSQSGDLTSTEDLFATPSLEPCRFACLVHGFSLILASLSKLHSS